MKKIRNIIVFVLFVLFVGFSYYFGYSKGIETAVAFKSVVIEMLKIIPAAFVLISLFEVWVKKETIEKHLGDDGNFIKYFWALLLAGFSMGGLFVALPIAQSLHKKGASLKVLFAYIAFSGIVRIPMTIFELNFLGLKFTAVRLIVTIPLFLVAGIAMGSYLSKRNYTFKG